MVPAAINSVLVANKNWFIASVVYNKIKYLWFVKKGPLQGSRFLELINKVNILRAVLWESVAKLEMKNLNPRSFFEWG